MAGSARTRLESQGVKISPVLLRLQHLSFLECPSDLHYLPLHTPPDTSEWESFAFTSSL